MFYLWAFPFVFGGISRLKQFRYELMKKSLFLVLSLITMGMTFNGCNTAITAPKKVSKQEEILRKKYDDPFEKSTDYVSKPVIPQYSYKGEEKYMNELLDVMYTEVGKYLTGNDVFFPIFKIVKVDEEDAADIKIYGIGNYLTYRVFEDTLIHEEGNDCVGCVHFKKEGDKLTFVEYEMAHDGKDFEPSLKEICHNDKKLFKEMMSAFDKMNETRTEIISEYVKENHLEIKHYTYGSDTFDIR